MRLQTAVLCIVVAVCTAVLAGCASSPKETSPALTQSASRSVDPLDTSKTGEQVACRH
jgi:type IV pilus biogenesis protein CpaD/CtpE